VHTGAFRTTPLALLNGLNLCPCGRQPVPLQARSTSTRHVAPHVDRENQRPTGFTSPHGKPLTPTSSAAHRVLEEVCEARQRDVDRVVLANLFGRCGTEMLERTGVAEDFDSLRCETVDIEKVA
jgi:hypothetical protein